MKRTMILLPALLFALAALPALAEPQEADDAAVWTMTDLSGRPVMTLAGRIWVDDEYISADNQLYVVVETDEQARLAVARHMGDEPAWDDGQSRAVFAMAEPGAEKGKRLICLYSTHSDESYEKGDGAASLDRDAGIYDVDRALKAELEKLGVEVKLDTATHLPHDAKAYSRSRRTAEELMKLGPDALLDIHRDGIPDEGEYETEVNGEATSKVRLLVGRSNPNAAANRAFAKQLKAVADEKYEGLVKDIFIGKGNYNQELAPQSLLLEFGTHTTDKAQAMDATRYMADVLNTVLYGESASAEGEGGAQRSRAGAGGAAWAVAIALLGGLIYAFVSTGSLKNLREKIAGGVSELTGGLFGRNREDK